jgi:hypothetical protein
MGHTGFSLAGNETCRAVYDGSFYAQSPANLPVALQPVPDVSSQFMEVAARVVTVTVGLWWCSEGIKGMLRVPDGERFSEERHRMTQSLSCVGLGVLAVAGSFFLSAVFF